MAGDRRTVALQENERTWRVRLHDATHDYLGVRPWVIIVSVVLGILMVTAVAVPGVWWADRKHCQRTADAMGREWRWGVFSDCLVRDDGGHWIPLDNLRSVTDGRR